MTDESALLQLPNSVEEKIPLDADHSMMVKFDSKNAPGYSSARAKLQQFARDATNVVANRFGMSLHYLYPALYEVGVVYARLLTCLDQLTLGSSPRSEQTEPVDYGPMLKGTLHLWDDRTFLQW